ncbi:LRR receptor-like serine/threonine-protein kinase ERL2 [Sesamum angolense]|uniref:non-specific serine/threonine protein kinase n=1 Tax=Sesamum angolense TaxID=2727404 RepID=A0AAE1W1M9_9LAMI|nr:LRR receptor-like serine/threonine-protein kinase ERL2 [Sesamum angolense]
MMVVEEQLFAERKTNMKMWLFYFVLVFFLLFPLASPLSDEGKALMSIKASFSNVANVLLDWDEVHNDDFCSWRGVSCGNISTSVVALNLSNLNLGGEISPAIGDLKSLQSLDLQGNRLTGQIPDEIGNCVSLLLLDLSNNLLEGDIPFSISKLKQLELLNLKNNQLTGPIPSTLTQIPNLKTLGLRGNMLTGTLSPDMCQLTGLCDVRGNNLTGTIPENIGNCTSFEILDISYNQITGEIPYNIGFLQVATLSLQGNMLTGKIPEVIGLMQALAVLDLSENELVGPIPPILGNLSYTGKLYLHGNKLTGPIPPELGNMTKLSYLQLNGNQLTGGIPAELGRLEQLFELNLANNNLEGPIPENISSCTALNQLNVHGNRLNGSIPSGLKHLESLTYLYVSFSTTVYCLDLSSNNFSGSVPASVGDLEHLLTLNVSYNYLDGSIPAEFGNLRSIQTIFIGNPLLCGHWLGSICDPYPPKSRAVFSRTTVVCITLGFITLLSMIIVAVYKSNQPKQFLKGSNKNLMQGSSKLVVLHMDMAIHTYEDIMRLTENLSEKYIIGCGASSTVYKCVLKNSRPIAIKRLYTQYPHDSREFETELETIGSIRHRNVVSLHGYSFSPMGNLLFYDYMENGSLWDLLHGPSKKVKLDWETRLKVAVGAAQGLSYLHHDCNPKIIHRDVKSSNILLDENFEAHLSDFGIAKCLPTAKTHASTYVLGTIGYIDPEYATTSWLTEKSDVYSFGIVLLELLTGKKAVDNDLNLLQLVLSKAENDTLMETVDPEVSVTCMDVSHVRKTFQLALLCTKRNPSERPTMHEVSRFLGSLLPPPPKKPCSAPPKNIDYSQFVIGKGQQPHLQIPQQQLQQDNNSSDAQWLLVR